MGTVNVGVSWRQAVAEWSSWQAHKRPLTASNSLSDVLGHARSCPIDAFSKDREDLVFHSIVLVGTSKHRHNTHTGEGGYVYPEAGNTETWTLDTQSDIHTQGAGITKEEIGRKT